MKSPAELAARLRKMILAAQHHYSPTGEPLRSIVVSPDWIDDLADAAHLIDQMEQLQAEAKAGREMTQIHQNLVAMADAWIKEKEVAKP